MLNGCNRPDAIIAKAFKHACLAAFIESASRMNVFFYGLFMDEALLGRKGVSPTQAEVGYVDGFQLHIGERATLVRSTGARSYGVMMTVSPDAVKELYAESSVADYVPESVSVELTDGSKAEAACYNLPADKLTGTNAAYAEALCEVAAGLGLPEAYLAEIRRAAVEPAKAR